MNLRVFLLNENKYLEASSVEVFLASYADGESLYWVDITQPDETALSEFLTPLKLHPLVLEGCLDPAESSSRVAPFQRSLFIKLSTQLGGDTAEQSFFSIICLLKKQPKSLGSKNSTLVFHKEGK